MSRSFRYDAPEPLSDLLVRPRLLRSLAGRWEHRVTVVIGGAGLGKTTLLAQALAENRLASRGDDVWIGLESDDAQAAVLAPAVTTALGRGDDEPSPAAVADLMWQRSPTEVCLVVDDVHRLPAGSAGAEWLRDLVDALPANGHVVLASRSQPPFPLARSTAQRAVLRIGEGDLRFTEEELVTFAVRHGIDRASLDGTAGWPAMATLTAIHGRHGLVDRDRPERHDRDGLAGAYLWEEVLEPLGPRGRHLLAVLCDLGGADDELVSAAVDAPVGLAPVLSDVPLVARDARNWFVPHDLWRSAPGVAGALGPAERHQVRRRAASELCRRGRFGEAFDLLAELALWDAVPDVLRAACSASERLGAGQMARWLAASPAAVRDTAEGRLVTGLHAAFTAPRDAAEPLQVAAARCRAQGHLDGEVVALAELIKLAWWRQDIAALAELGSRVVELDVTGHRTVRALAAFGRAMLADMAGDDAAVLAELDGIEPSALDASWRVHVNFLRAIVHQERGDLDLAIELVDQAASSTDATNRYVIDTVRVVSRWKQGWIDEVVEQTPALIEAARRTGVRYNLYLGLAMATTMYAHAGDPAAAQTCFDESLACAPPLPDGRPTVQLALARAALRLAEGHEAEAACTLQDAVDTHGLDQPGDRRAWVNAIALAYVLVPETRKHWDGAVLRGNLALARAAARAVVAVREGRGDELLAAPSSSPASSSSSPDPGELTDPVAIRGVLHVRLAAELALALAARGRPEGRALLELLGPAGRSALRDLAAREHRQAKPVRALLAAVPAPPPRCTWVAVLGPLDLRRDGPNNPNNPNDPNDATGDDGHEQLDPIRRRPRVLTLLAFLIEHRRTTRGAIAAALWPDLDPPAASNNLAVTLNHLLRGLDPWRHRGEPSYLLRLDGPHVRLVTGDYLRVDTDQFDDHLAAAARAETQAAPSVVLAHTRAAVDLYRDHLYADLPEAGWFTLAREHYRTRFVRAAVRAGQLLLGHGDGDEAELLARRALSVDPWAEDAHAILIGAALARGDRSAAHRRLGRCLESLAELDLDPSDGIQQLRRRLQGPGSP
jgi:ATP/maltotriose-dependent transcriptional regulator MalT/DNA-binding SARP family transcriptional activator